MAGLIAALFGGKNRPDTDPQPGIGGYDLPRGPAGQGGFPGSTPGTVPTHTQGDDGRRERQLSASASQDQWKRLPTRARTGMPRQPKARVKAQCDDTLRSYTPVVGANAPGSQNVRNTVAQHYKANPATIREYLSAPNPGTNGGRSSGNDDHGNVIGGNPSPVTVQSRYVSAEGAQEGFATDRRIPYMIHHRPEGYRGTAAVRGADLSGQRYTMEGKENFVGLPDGGYGIGRLRGPLHRPVRFEKPGPWSANFYDVAPDTGSHAPDMIHQSPSKHGTVKSKPIKPRVNKVETRRHPSRKVRRG